MKFQIRGKDLNRLVSQAGVFSAPDASHPAYSLTKIDVVKGSMIRISVVNSISGCRFTAPVEEAEDGSVCVDSAVLRKVASGVSAGALVSFYTDETRLSYKEEDGLAGFLPTADVDNFIKLKTPPKEGWNKIKSKVFEEAANRVAWAASHNENRPVLTNVHMTPDYTEASDGYRLARHGHGLLAEGEDPVMVRAVFVNAVRNLLAGESEEIAINVREHIWVRGHGWAVYALPSAGTYYKIDGMFYDPDEVNGISVSRPHLRNALTKIMKSVGGRPMTIDIGDQALILTARGEDGSLASHQVPFVVDTEKEPDLETLGQMAVSSELFRDAVVAYDTDVIRVMWRSAMDTIQLDGQGLRVSVCPIARG